jgi:hypothetical protein
MHAIQAVDSALSHVKIKIKLRLVSVITCDED